MKTPKKKEVVKYFKNAKEVECVFDEESYNITVDIIRKIHKFNDGYWMKTAKGEIHLWDKNKGYAKILSYKEPKEKTYKITREQIVELCMPSLKTNRERLELIFPEVFETKLTVGKWYKSLKCPKQIIYVIQFNDVQQIRAYGFNIDGDWESDNCRFSWGLPSDGDFTEATEQEVTEALTKEAVRKGYNTDKPTHFNYKNGTGYLQNPSKSDFLFRDGILYLWDIKIFEEGKWAEIIPTLTIPEAEAKLNCKIV